MYQLTLTFISYCCYMLFLFLHGMTRSMHEEITIVNLKGIDVLMSILVKEDKPCTQFLRYGTESHRRRTLVA